MLVGAVVCLAAVMLPGCSGDSEITVAAAVIPVPATPDEAAAYLTITNTGDGDDELTGATSDVASAVHLHETSIDGSGFASMTSAGTLEIPAASTIALRPGALHLMLVSPSELTEGDTVQLTLTFRDAGRKRVTAKVITDLSDVFG